MAEQEDGWRPIETAPEGNQMVLLCSPDLGVFVGYRRTVGYQPVASGGYWLQQPTHWRPLPAPPAQGGDKTEDTLDGQ